MSDLWRVQVVGVHDQEIHLRVEAIHPDAGAFSDSKLFALRLLADTVSRTQLKDAAPKVVAPLGAETGPEVYGDDGLMREKADKLIVSVALSDVKNSPFDEEASKERINAQLRAKGLKTEDGEAWQRAFDEAWNNFWRSPADLPSATYTIRVNDARWLTHLSPGMDWNTAAYG